jgi:hypothetical protein
MSESHRANTSPDESAYAKPPRRSGEAGSQESQSRGKLPSDSDIIAELGDELGGPA